ncbi:hypothetical protein Pla22_20310 [Rubripirellula amarantea]|uniref:Uncharacterized protein n=1 Tax=Rubripirellula amarantea TaxID=2527999 RepID=A0A5C5WTY4_9BACT|nr:hypothetical protein Pla22_20310 [Rubripirellula amarantea]
MEAEFIKTDLESLTSDQMKVLWSWVDETSLNPGQRQGFIANGLRAGIVVDEARFRQQLKTLAPASDVVDDFLSSASVASRVNEGVERIPMRIGRRYELPVGKPNEGEHVTLVRIDSQTIGRTVQDPQYLFALEPVELTPQRQLHLRLRPEVQYGEMKQAWVGSDSAMRIDRRREVWTLSELDLDVIAQENDLLVITADRMQSEDGGRASIQESSALATKMMTGSSAQQTNEQLFVLIRVIKIPDQSAN